MKTFLFLILFTGLFHSEIFTQNKQLRESIIPLRSTRTDVEKILGKSKDGCNNCIYQNENETIDVSYSKATCDEGWNVPIDTVLSVTVTPKSSLDIKTFEVNLSDFIIATNGLCLKSA